MDSGASNPYSTPQAQPDPPADSGYLSPLPPYTPARLAIAFGLICVGWLLVWALSRDMIRSGFMIPVIPLMMRWFANVTNPHSQRTGGNFKWYHMVLSIGGFVAFMIFLWSDKGLLWTDKELPPWIKEVAKHPATHVLGWVISCGWLFNDWRKRRNNPPYQPKPHAELPSESPWKPLPRQ
jgi:hypothetical protein